MENKERKGIDWTIAETRRGEGAIETFIYGRGSSIRALIISVFALAIPTYVFYRGLFGALSVRTDRSIMVTLVLCLVFLVYPLGRRSWKEKPGWPFFIDIICFLLSLGTGAYVIWGDTSFDTSILRIAILGYTVDIDYMVGIAAILMLLEAARRTLGWLLMVLPLLFMGYALFAEHLPELLCAPSIPWDYLISLLFLEQEGIYGIGTHVLITMVYLFLLFGVILRETRIGAFFIALVNSLVGHTTGGQPKVAIGASALMGTLSGSAIGNAATTGAITIPLMKKSGFEPEFAASVESVASNGGQILPPIMGAAAFYMAANLGISYADLVLYASIPAALYFISVFLVANKRSLRLGLKGLPRNELPSTRKVLLEGGHLLIPLVLIFYMLFTGFSITRVGCAGVLSVIILSFVSKDTRLSPTRFLVTLEEGARANMPICVACILVGIIIGPIMSSGIGMRFSMLVIDISGGSLIVTLILTAVLSIILGMGMPTLLVYITLSIFVAPSLVELGLTPLSAHLFIFYFGIASGITPPVCLVAFTAGAIAGTPPMRTGYAAVRTGIASFVVPFFFAFNPAMLAQGFGLGEIGIAIGSGLVGVVLFAMGVEGYFFRRLSVYERAGAFLGGVSSLVPDLTWKVVGLGLLALIAFSQKTFDKRSERGPN